MIKHFCDICKNEMTQRIRVNITAKEVYGEGYLKTVGENLMDINCECCSECYNKLVDIVDTVGQEKPCPQTIQPLTIFDKLRKLIKSDKEG